MLGGLSLILTVPICVTTCSIVIIALMERMSRTILLVLDSATIINTLSNYSSYNFDCYY